MPLFKDVSMKDLNKCYRENKATLVSMYLKENFWSGDSSKQQGCNYCEQFELNEPFEQSNGNSNVIKTE